MIIYVQTITARLQYISDFIGKETGGDRFFQLTDDIHFYKNNSGPKFNYSAQRIRDNEFFLSPHPLLFEKDIKQQPVDCFTVNNYKAFFKTEGDFPFDIFAASFYLLSRYEEYLPHKKDEYGRYAHENSLAFREGFLYIPLINYWIKDFRNKLAAQFPIPDPVASGSKPRTSFLPTYDIDQAFSYKHKPLWKNIAGFAKAFIKGDRQRAKERWNVLAGKSKDPFDAYQWMDELHRKYKLKPHYFFILAARPGKYDKNISPSKAIMKELIRQHYRQYPVGIHPSWQSGDDISLINDEIQTLKQITGHAVSNSRQHYIRFTLPGTFRQLLRAGIKNDFSMGYGSINGFRASVASAFYWFDLEKDETTDLLLHPFCFMDANSYYEQGYSAQQAYEEMKNYYETVNAAGGILISIWHNNFLGTDKLYAGWKEAYEKFITEISL